MRAWRGFAALSSPSIMRGMHHMMPMYSQQSLGWMSPSWFVESGRSTARLLLLQWDRNGEEAQDAMTMMMTTQGSEADTGVGWLSWAIWLVKRTFQPSKLKRNRQYGFLNRLASKVGGDHLVGFCWVVGLLFFSFSFFFFLFLLQITQL